MALRKAWLWALLLFAPVLSAQSTRLRDLGVGKILVASRDLKDPHFAQSVILLVQWNEDGVVGLFLNHPTTMPISKALEVAGAKGSTDPIYIGGPVSPTSVLALARLSAQPENSDTVLGDVRLISSQKALAGILASAPGPAKLRVYVGYTGWTPAQLGREVERGSWFIFPADAASVFDAKPESLWNRLIDQTGAQYALLRGN